MDFGIVNGIRERKRLLVNCKHINVGREQSVGNLYNSKARNLTDNACGQLLARQIVQLDPLVREDDLLVVTHADKKDTAIIRYIVIVHIGGSIIDGGDNVALGRCSRNALNMAESCNAAEAVLVAGRHALLGDLLAQVLAGLVADSLLRAVALVYNGGKRLVLGDGVLVYDVLYIVRHAVAVLALSLVVVQLAGEDLVNLAGFLADHVNVRLAVRAQERGMGIQLFYSF